MASVEKKDSWKLFDQIATSYDRLNHLLSFNIDVYWRKKILEYVPTYPCKVVDLATGTGDVLLTLLEHCDQIESAMGVDLSQEMLRMGERKIFEAGHYEKTEMCLGDAMNLKMENDSVDLVTMAFGIRNTADPLKTLSEMYRILRKGGTAVVLEFSLPKNFFIRNFFLLYFRFILPWIGGIISKNKTAYKYLNTSVEAFPYGEDFVNMMKEAKYLQPVYFPLTFGIATLYVGKK